MVRTPLRGLGKHGLYGNGRILNTRLRNAMGQSDMHVKRHRIGLAVSKHSRRLKCAERASVRHTDACYSQDAQGTDRGAPPSWLEPGPGFGVGRGFAIWDPFPVQAPDKAPESCTWSTRSEGGRQLAKPQPRRKPDRLEVPKMRWTCESPVSSWCQTSGGEMRLPTRVYDQA